MPTVKHGGISVDYTDKKPYVHARRSTKNSSIGAAAKSKKDFGFDIQYHKNKTSGGIRITKNKGGSNITFGIRKKFARGGSVGNSMIKQAQRDYKGSYISGSLGGVKVGNPSLKKYYKGML